MAGLACGEPSLLAWQELERGGLRLHGDSRRGGGGGHAVCWRGRGSWRASPAWPAWPVCLLAAADPAARATLGLGAHSRVLAFNTEGATDPAAYDTIVKQTPGRATASRRS